MQSALHARARGNKRRVAPFSLVNPRIGFIGDSIVQFFSYLCASMTTGNSVTRDASGNETWTGASGAQVKGNPLTFQHHMTDTSFNSIGRALWNGTTLTRTTGVTGAAGSTNPTSGLAGLSDFGRHTQRSDFVWLNALHNGGLTFVGNLGENGFLAESIYDQIDKLIALGVDVIYAEGGVNNVYLTAQTKETVLANVLANINRIRSKGAFALVPYITPVTAAYGNYTAQHISDTQWINSQLLIDANNNPSNTAVVDLFTPLFNVSLGSGGAGDPTYYADGIHPNAVGNKARAAAVFSVTSSLFTTVDILPTSSSDNGPVVRYTGRYNVGPWATTSGGTFVNAGSGSLPPTWKAGRAGGGATGTFTITDPGDGKGCWVNGAITGTASTDIYDIWPWGNGGITLSALSSAFVAAGVSSGINVGDEIAFGVELSWTNAQACNIKYLTVYTQTNGSGQYGRIAVMDGSEGAATGFPDSGSGVFVTGKMLIMSGMTGMTPAIEISFNGASTSAINLSVRRVTVFKCN